jgi:hypothetical protein
MFKMWGEQIYNRLPIETTVPIGAIRKPMSHFEDDSLSSSALRGVRVGAVVTKMRRLNQSDWTNP